MNKNFPKPLLYTVGVIVLAIFVIVTWVLPYKAMQRCLDSGGAYAQSLAQCDNELKDVPPAKLVGLVFIRMIDGQRVSYIQQADLPNVGVLDGHKFSLEVKDNGLNYRMVMRGQTTTGALNTERGFGADENAVVYILNSDQAPEKQLRFLRRVQGDVNQLVQIGPDGKLLENARP
ncbi:MAG: hypothetical protein CFE39_07720 [Comamonadaceae bacterium PBBC2]|nr:MAG: hypothetical protein CFE39_07720 [Comamonadaceae bacterium PBBC2]